MSELPMMTSQLGGTSPPPTDGAVARALKTANMLISLQAIYQLLLERSVFSMVVIEDRKDEASFRNTLRDSSALPVLAIIWKESPLVSIADLLSVGMEKAYSAFDPVNAHALAVELAGDAREKEAVQKRVSAIVKAGVAYALIERRSVPKSNAFELLGTSRLHAFMLELHSAARECVATNLATTVEV